eukprot:4547395-Prymnesium_polylepis.1
MPPKGHSHSRAQLLGSQQSSWDSIPIINEDRCRWTATNTEDCRAIFLLASTSSVDAACVRSSFSKS